MNKDKNIENKNNFFTEKVEEMVAIGAAIASNCDACFKFHYQKALSLGISQKDILQAVETANKIKQVPANKILNYARDILIEDISEDDNLARGDCCSR